MTPTETEVRVRYAPSPTGHWHVGGVRTLLFNLLFARKHGGAFIIRVEDTDQERSDPAYEAEIFSSLGWLGLDYDEGPVWRTVNGDWQIAGERGEYGPYRQSERRASYRRYLEQLLQSGHAYVCYCTKEELEAERQALAAEGLPPKYGGHCRARSTPPAGRTPQVIRFKIPERPVEFQDMVRGTVTFNAALFGDVVIARSLDSALYSFAVVVDDELMRVSHVIRGEDHISNTPKQLLFQQALGFRTPLYAHIPLILNPDRSKMSKRFSETSLASYRDAGYLPEALINFLALLGWHPKDDQELMTRKELIQAFNLKHVQKAGAVFNVEKLNWLNREYVKRLPAKDLAEQVMPFIPEDVRHAVDPARLLRAVELARERLTTLRDFWDAAHFFFVVPDYEVSLLVWKEDAPARAKEMLERLQEVLSVVPAGQFTKEELAAVLAPLVDECGRGSVLWPLRVALSGLTASPDGISIAAVLGKEEATERLALALRKLGE